MHFVDLQTLWKEKLKYKFQNSRKRHDKDMEVCKKRKRKIKETGLETSQVNNSSLDESINFGSCSPEQVDATEEMLMEALDNSPTCSMQQDSTDANDTSQFGLQRYLPATRPESETDETVKAHVNNMKAEVKKRDSDKTKINKLMDLTFVDRRIYIVTQNPDVPDVLGTYPALKNEEQVITAFNIMMKIVVFIYVKCDLKSQKEFSDLPLCSMSNIQKEC